MQKSGVPSWTWLYPHHYAPLAMDIAAAELRQPSFEMGRPLSEAVALVCVLPRNSSSLLPDRHQPLIQEGGALAEFFPERCKIDLNGKLHEYEAVVLLPGIDFARVEREVASCDRDPPSDPPALASPPG